VGPLQAQASAIGYPPLLADVLISAGNVYGEKGIADEAARVLEQAMWTALRCRHDEAAAEAATSLVFQVGCLQSRFEAAEVWMRMAEALLDRMGGHDLIRGWLLTNRAAVREIQGQLAEALEDAQRAVAAKERVLGAGHFDIAYTLNNVALYLDGLGDTAQAVSELARAVQIVENGLGPDHPRIATMLSNYSELLNRVGRFADARDAATRALVVLEREADPQGLFITYPLVSLGITYLGLDQIDRAVPILERAHAIRELKEPSAAKRAEARFALARALARQGDDPARARALARTAREEYRQSPMTPALARELATVEAWLAAQPPAG